jgi:CDP-6-deoxy-D-xylo-4-hexulose-3-dehydrase
VRVRSDVHVLTYAYNLKMNGMQGAVGVSKLRSLPEFIRQAQANFNTLYAGLKDLEALYILRMATLGSEPRWFGFPVFVRPNAPFRPNQVNSSPREPQNRDSAAVRRQFPSAQ